MLELIIAVHVQVTYTCKKQPAPWDRLFHSPQNRLQSKISYFRIKPYIENKHSREYKSRLCGGWSSHPAGHILGHPTDRSVDELQKKIKFFEKF